MNSIPPLTTAPVAAVPVAIPPITPPQSDYAQLKARVVQRALLQKRHGWYIRLSLALGASVLVGVAMLLLVESFALRVLAALWLGIVSTQLGFFGHDAIHQQVFRSSRANDILGLICKNLLLGVSASWWKSDHTRHHTYTNLISRDPNIEIPVFAFTDEQAQSKRGLLRCIVRLQHVLMFPLFSLESVAARIETVRYLRQKGSRRMGIEIVLLTLHCVGYVMIFCSQGILAGLGLILIHQATTGVYLTSTFATNHKGMPLLDPHTKLDYVRRQVLTSRNVSGNALVAIAYGGLNFQIEHHLFPTLPRPNLPAAREVVIAFCKEQDIAYHETGVLESYREILGHLRQITRRMAVA